MVLCSPEVKLKLLCVHTKFRTSAFLHYSKAVLLSDPFFHLHSKNGQTFVFFLCPTQLSIIGNNTLQNNEQKIENYSDSDTKPVNNHSFCVFLCAANETEHLCLSHCAAVCC